MLGGAKGRISGLDRIHALAGDVEALGEILLAPVPLGTKHSETVVHQHLPSPSVTLLAMEPIAWPKYQRTTIQ